MKDTVATIEYNKKISKQYFHLGLKTDWENFTPGQFVMLQAPQNAAFLRRPFGIVKLENSVVELCIKVVGKGTAALSQIETGEKIAILGPLGNGFSPPAEHTKALLVAGGFGVAPLLPLAQTLKAAGKDVIFYSGGKTATDILYKEEIETLGVNLKITTEDGSSGEKGLITEPLRKDIENSGQVMIFASGPEGLMKEIAKISQEQKIPAQVSLDSYMACGLGVCLGCAVKRTDGTYTRACKEGPVFDTKELHWDF